MDLKSAAFLFLCLVTVALVEGKGKGRGGPGGQRGFKKSLILPGCDKYHEELGRIMREIRQERESGACESEDRQMCKWNDQLFAKEQMTEEPSAECLEQVKTMYGMPIQK